MSQRFLDPCQFYGDGHGGRPRNSAYTWAAIPKGRQGKDRRRKWRNPLPCQKRGHVLQVQAQGGAALPDMLGQ